MNNIKFHNNGEISVRMSKELAQKIALAMGSVYDEIGEFNEANYELQNQATAFHRGLNNDKVWRNK